MAIEHFEKRDGLDSGLNDIMVSLVDFDNIAKRVQSFCVVQVFFEEERCHEIIKFDSAHGFCHVHKYYQKRNSCEALFNKSISYETIRECRKDIRENWQKYKQWFLEKRLL